MERLLATFIVISVSSIFIPAAVGQSDTASFEVRRPSTKIAELKVQYERLEREVANQVKVLRVAMAKEGNSRKEKVERAELERLVQQCFESRLALQHEQLAHAEAQLAETRKQLGLREEVAEDVIRRRVEELIAAEESGSGTDGRSKKPQVIQTLERYFRVELDVDENDRVTIVYRATDRQGHEAVIEHPVESMGVGQIQLDSLELKRSMHKITSVSDLKKFWESVTASGFAGVYLESISGGRTRLAELKRRTDEELPADLQSKLRDTLGLLTARKHANEDLLKGFDTQPFDGRHNQAVKNTIPEKIVEQQVQLRGFEAQKLQLQKLKNSKDGKRLDEVNEQLNLESIAKDEALPLNQERIRLERSLSTQIIAIVGADASLSDASIKHATDAIEQKALLVQAKLRKLKSTLEQAEAEYSRFNKRESDRRRLNSQNSKIGELLEVVTGSLGLANAAD